MVFLGMTSDMFNKFLPDIVQTLALSLNKPTEKISLNEGVFRRALTTIAIRNSFFTGYTVNAKLLLI